MLRMSPSVSWPVAVAASAAVTRLRNRRHCGRRASPSPAGDIHLDLGALLREVRSPTRAAPTRRRSTFAMVTPIPAVAGGAPPTSVSAAVHLLQPASGALDVTVDVEPIAFELRNDVLMQTIDFIDRCIKRPLSRMKADRPGAHGSKMPALARARAGSPSTDSDGGRGRSRRCVTRRPSAMRLCYNQS